jgi:HNH endonuclease
MSEFRNCLQCGKSFRVDRHINANKKFCSKACANKSRANPLKRRMFTCQWCGKEFEEWAYRNPTICSSQCRSEYGGRKRGNQMYKGGPISRGLSWLRQARLVRKRDNYTCQACGRNGKIHKFRVHVHHIRPYREFNGDYKKANHHSNLVSLCPACHPKVERGIIPCPSPKS